MICNDNPKWYVPEPPEQVGAIEHFGLSEIIPPAPSSEEDADEDNNTYYSTGWDNGLQLT